MYEATNGGKSEGACLTDEEVDYIIEKVKEELQ